MHSPDPIPIIVKRLPHFAGLTLPAYATDGAAGRQAQVAAAGFLDERHAGHGSLAFQFFAMAFRAGDDLVHGGDELLEIVIAFFADVGEQRH